MLHEFHGQPPAFYGPRQGIGVPGIRAHASVSFSPQTLPYRQARAAHTLTPGLKLICDPRYMSHHVASRSPRAERCRRKFLLYFKKGFRDPAYIDWERGYKERAHQQWIELLDKEQFGNLLKKREYAKIAGTAVKIESRTNLLFSFEKTALRDAVKSDAGARCFATSLYHFLHGSKDGDSKFEDWCEAISELPRQQTRVLNWPLITVWGFIAQPERHMFLKPNVTRRAAEAYGYDLHYESKPQWRVYQSLLHFAQTVRKDTSDLHPLDMIDLQSFIWVQGSEEYPE